MKIRKIILSAAVLSLTMTVRSRGVQPPETGSPPPLVAHEELQKRLADPALRLIDARSRADYDGGHIPGAVWLDPKVFEPLTRGEAATDRAAWGRMLAPLGVGPETEILVYDDDRYHLPAGRVWFWLSYAADARAVGLIDGRFSSWERAGRPVSTGETRGTARNAGVTFRPRLLASQ
jgi:thiosulfate/3-mercaptopyruvate sulfurtransferase